jgi:hypothetical protein
MNEKLLEKKLREKVKMFGGLALKIWCVSLAGFPDRIVLMPEARIWFVELKTTGKKPTAIQNHIHGLLTSLGFSVWVIDNEMRLQNFLNEIKK